jgi:DNA-binding NarL/FixJ family response regulator
MAKLRPVPEENQPGKKRILVVEDNAFVRECLVRYINMQEDLICCGEADSIATAPGVMALKEPELVLLDLRLKDGESFGLIEMFKAQSPALLVLVLSQADEAFYAEKALSCGAKGYVMKQKGPAELLSAIRTVLNGGIYVSRALGANLGKSADASGVLNPGISSEGDSGSPKGQAKTL